MAPLADERGRRELLECSLGEPRAWLVALEARIEAIERRQATMTMLGSAPVESTCQDLGVDVNGVGRPPAGMPSAA